VVSVLATRPKGGGFEPVQGDGFLRAIKIRSIPSFRMGNKGGGLMSQEELHGDGVTKFSFPSPTSHSLQRRLGWQVDCRLILVME
jgi:hypothetical protein